MDVWLYSLLGVVTAITTIGVVLCVENWRVGRQRLRSIRWRLTRPALDRGDIVRATGGPIAPGAFFGGNDGGPEVFIPFAERKTSALDASWLREDPFKRREADALIPFLRHKR